MTLTIHKEEDDQRQLKVTVEVEESRVQKQIDQFLRKFSREANIPGFRRGKVPKRILIQRLGMEAIRAESVEEMIESLWAEIMEEINADELAHYQPVMDEMELNPLVLKLTVPLEPIVTLGDYRAIRKEIEPVEVTDEALEEAIEHLRGHHQVVEEVERAAEAGDMVKISGTGFTVEDDEEFWHVHGADVVLDSEKAFPGLPIVDNIIGMSIEEEKEFTFTFPEDYEEEELAGKEAKMNITLELVQSRFVPELDDELAQKEGEFETADELIEKLREDLLEQAQQQAKSELMDSLVDEMMEDVEMVFPPAAVEAEIDTFVQSLKSEAQRAKIEWADFIRAQEGGESALREQWRESAEKNVRRGLTLRQFVKEEKIKVTEADIDLAMEDRLSKFADNEELKEQLRSIFMQGQSFESMQQTIIEEKIYDRMKAVVSGTAPDLDSLEEEDEILTEEEE